MNLAALHRPAEDLVTLWLLPSSSPSAHPTPKAESDLLYNEYAYHMQRGNWRGAAEALALLRQRHPDKQSLSQLRETLSLKLAVEETWWQGRSRSNGMSLLRSVAQLLTSRVAVPAR